MVQGSVTNMTTECQWCEDNFDWEREDEYLENPRMEENEFDEYLRKWLKDIPDRGYIAVQDRWANITARLGPREGFRPPKGGIRTNNPEVRIVVWARYARELQPNEIQHLISAQLSKSKSGASVLLVTAEELGIPGVTIPINLASNLSSVKSSSNPAHPRRGI